MRCRVFIAGRQEWEDKKREARRCQASRWPCVFPLILCALVSSVSDAISAAKLGRKLHQTEIMSDYQSWHQFGAA